MRAAQRAQAWAGNRSGAGKPPASNRPLPASRDAALTGIAAKAAPRADRALAAIADGGPGDGVASGRSAAT